jgi:DNA-binding MarR family transcriptional regulator
MHIGNVVAAWATTVHDRLRAGMRQLGVEHRDLAALTLVSAYDGCSPDWLRRRVDLTQSGTVRLVDRLVARGLVSRGRSTGRGVPLHLTPAGDDLLRRWAISRDEIITELLAGLAPEPATAVVAAMANALRTGQRVRQEADTACRTCTWPACGDDCPVDRSVAGTAP